MKKIKSSLNFTRNCIRILVAICAIVTLVLLSPGNSKELARAGHALILVGSILLLIVNSISHKEIVGSTERIENALSDYGEDVEKCYNSLIVLARESEDINSPLLHPVLHLAVLSPQTISVVLEKIYRNPKDSELAADLFQIYFEKISNHENLANLIPEAKKHLKKASFLGGFGTIDVEKAISVALSQAKFWGVGATVVALTELLKDQNLLEDALRCMTSEEWRFFKNEEEADLEKVCPVCKSIVSNFSKELAETIEAKLHPVEA